MNKIIIIFSCFVFAFFNMLSRTAVEKYTIFHLFIYKKKIYHFFKFSCFISQDNNCPPNYLHIIVRRMRLLQNHHNRSRFHPNMMCSNT